MEKGRARWWCGLGCSKWCGFGETADEDGDDGDGEGRNGWKSKCAVVALVNGDVVDGDVGEGRDRADVGGGGEGVSVTLISGEAGGGDMDRAEEDAGGLAGSTTSTGRLSRLIMVERLLVNYCSDMSIHKVLPIEQLWQVQRLIQYNIA